jgi:hypothetical protein
MFGKNPFNEYRATQQQVQEKKVIDAESIDGSTVADVDASIQEQKFVIPEEIPANERTAFHGAAAAAAKAGKKSFNFAGKSHPVTMKKDTAKAIADDAAVTVKGKYRAANNPFRGGRPTVKTEGMYKDMDTEKGEPSPRSDAKVKADMKKRRKGEKNEVEMNPKLDKGTKDNSMEQKESTGIRAKLMAVLSENDRAKHYKGATKPETMDDKLSGKGAKDMMEPAKNPKVDDTEEKGHQDAVKAGKTGPQAKARSGGDNTRSGDQKIKPSATPVKGVKAAMEAYASMNEETHMTIRNGADGLDAAGKATHKKEYEKKHAAKVTFSGNGVTYSGKKANVAKAARAHFPDHKEDGMPSDIHKWHDGKDIHVKHSGV